MKEKQSKNKSFIMDGIIKRKINGYIFVRVGKFWIPEHRLVVEEKLERTLEKGEVIHHIDGNKENNEIDNLMLFPNQKEHAKFHNKVQQFGLTNNILMQIENRWSVTLK